MRDSDDLPRTTHLFFLLLALMCILFIVWGHQGRLDIVSLATGEVVPTGKIKHVQHFEGGIIRAIKVAEGQAVSVGQPLMALEQLRSGASLEEINARVESLTLDAARFEALRQDLDQPVIPQNMEQTHPDLVREALELFYAGKKSFESKCSKLKTIISQREQRIKSIQAQLANKLERLPLLEEELALSEDLLKDNLTTRIKHLGILNRKKEIQGLILKDKSALKESRHALNETKEKLNEAVHLFREETAEKLKQTHQELKEFSARLKKYKDSLDRTIIRSPINGVVKRLHRVTRGGVIQPGDTLVDIVPSQERLIIEAHLNISDIGYIRTGQDVQLRLPDKDAGKFKKLAGKVTTISPDSFTDNRGRTFYVVLIQSDKNYFEAGTEKYRLYPGMILMAYIHIGQRSVLAYLLDPFVNTLSFSLQER
ncbi:HlyD family type I secretion periplasmic adaptor subunit [Desulfobacter latus]|uniref:HlyD family type I secretion periplasmic adaptor subunit n=1 Tax=Desulfobacter latus TaxID=2292 RepID=A0A850T3S1_9BACT|nr:HlyD family type I secretion periplasmic adaptor subunit [Desulfobacter latus]NWH03455.1 HlyD family type I secretion periplasmic adaptor subunit [Desulfobacter latus]